MISIADSGVYSSKVTNGIETKWMNFSLIVTDDPKVKVFVIEKTDNGLYQNGSEYTLKCTATGYPAPKISWTFKSCKSYNKCYGPITNLVSTLDISNG